MTFASGRDLTIGHGIVHPVPIALDPAPYRGAMVYGEDDYIYRSNGTQWLAIPLVRANPETIDVGAGQRFSCYQPALEWLQQFLPELTDHSPQVTLRAVAGHVAEEPIKIGRRDMSWITLSAADAVVNVPRTAMQPVLGTNDEAFILATYGSSPRVSTHFVYSGPALATGGLATDGKRLNGAYILGGKIVVLGATDLGEDDEPDDPTGPARGFSGFSTNVRVTSFGTLQANGGTFNNAGQNSLVIISSNAKLSGCVVRNAAGSSFAAGVASRAAIYSSDLRKGEVASTDPLAADISCSRSSVIDLYNPDTLGGLNTAPNVWTTRGMIRDPRDASPPTLNGLIKAQSYTVGALPSPASNTGVMVYVTNGAAGLPILAFSDGTNWLRSDTRTVVSDS
jgi:hypothetical protein